MGDVLPIRSISRLLEMDIYFTILILINLVILAPAMYHTVRVLIRYVYNRWFWKGDLHVTNTATGEVTVFKSRENK